MGTSSKLSFEASGGDRRIINQIARRALQMARAMPSVADVVGADLVDWEMCITATHASGNPLRLADLRDADDFNFAHDVFGIYRHLNRATGQLENCFVPRYSVPEKACTNG